MWVVNHTRTFYLKIQLTKYFLNVLMSSVFWLSLVKDLIDNGTFRTSDFKLLEPQNMATLSQCGLIVIFYI